MTTLYALDLSFYELQSKQKWTLAAGISLLFIVGQIFLPLWVILLGVGSALFGYIIIQSNLLTLISYIAMIVIVKMFPSPKAVIAPHDFVAGILLTAILLSFIFQRKWIERRLSLVPHSALYFAVFYAVWASIVGLMFVIMGENSISVLYREFLMFSPLIYVPILFVAITERDESQLNILFYFIIIMWGLDVIVSVLHVRQSLLEVTYIYQTGLVKFDVVGPSVMFFTLFSLSTLESQRKRKILYVIGILASLVWLIMTFNRTGEVLTLALAPFLFLSVPKSQRKNRNKIIGGVVIMVFVIFLSLYFLSPIIQLLMKWVYAKFLTSSNVRTDASLFNRYIEWRYVLQQIVSTPIGGVGFGGYFKDYLWINGYTIQSVYTHNGILSVLLKSGIVGFILIFTAHIRFFILGLKLFFSSKLTDTESAFVRAGLFVILLMTFHMFTSGVFMHREILWHMGLVWGYYIYLERKVQMRLVNFLPGQN